MNEVQQAIESRLRDIIREVMTEVLQEALPTIIENHFKDSNDPLRKYYTKEQVCQKLGICHATYHNWINSGKISERKIRGRVYVDTREIENALSEGIIRKGVKKSSDRNQNND